MVKSWVVEESRRDTSYRVFHLRTDLARSPLSGRKHEFYVMESCPWVNVIPITSEREVIFIRQYRHGIREATLEIPGGLVDPGLTPRAAAEKELMEETGYSSSNWVPMGWVHPNPAIMNNRCYTFLARHAILSGVQRLDEAEDIDVLSRPLSEVPELIRKGEITHSLVVVAFYRLFFELAQPWVGGDSLFAG